MTLQHHQGVSQESWHPPGAVHGAPYARSKPKTQHLCNNYLDHHMTHRRQKSDTSGSFHTETLVGLGKLKSILLIATNDGSRKDAGLGHTKASSAARKSCRGANLRMKWKLSLDLNSLEFQPPFPHNTPPPQGAGVRPLSRDTDGQLGPSWASFYYYY